MSPKKKKVHEILLKQAAGGLWWAHATIWSRSAVVDWSVAVEWGWWQVILCRTDGERGVVVHQHLFHESGVILSETIRWNACLQPLAQAGVVKYTERTVRVMSLAHEM